MTDTCRECGGAVNCQHCHPIQRPRDRERIAELEAALDRIRRIHPEGMHKSAADAFFECAQIADAAMAKRKT